MPPASAPAAARPARAARRRHAPWTRPLALLLLSLTHPAVSPRRGGRADAASTTCFCYTKDTGDVLTHLQRRLDTEYAGQDSALLRMVRALKGTPRNPPALSTHPRTS